MIEDKSRDNETSRNYKKQTQIFFLIVSTLFDAAKNAGNLKFLMPAEV